MEFSLKLVVSIVVAIGIVMLMTLLLQGQTGSFPSYVDSVIPLS